jgi:hypothetical protein
VTRTVIAVACWGFLGCATTYRGVETVVAEVQRDEVAAAVNMKDQSVGLQGRVKAKGLKTEKVVVANSSAYPAPFGFGKTEVVLQDKNLGFIELESTTAQPGKALCLFESWALEKLAAVREGETVRLACQFFKVEGETGDRVPVFHKCFVDD